jgi:hypothetical protein
MKDEKGKIKDEICFEYRCCNGIGSMWDDEEESE